jgi:hypothetical protein
VLGCPVWPQPAPVRKGLNSQVTCQKIPSKIYMQCPFESTRNHSHCHALLAARCEFSPMLGSRRHNCPPQRRRCASIHTKYSILPRLRRPSLVVVRPACSVVSSLARTRSRACIRQAPAPTVTVIALIGRATICAVSSGTRSSSYHDALPCIYCATVRHKLTEPDNSEHCLSHVMSHIRIWWLVRRKPE